MFGRGFGDYLIAPLTVEVQLIRPGHRRRVPILVWMTTNAKPYEMRGSTPTILRSSRR
jgi:hypothetical protein